MRKPRGIEAFLFAGVPALCLFLTASSSPIADTSDPAGGPARRAGPPAGGRVEAEWQARVERDLAEREYDLSWQGAPTVVEVEAAWHAPNRAQGFRTWFAPEGIRVLPRTEADPQWRWGVSLAGYGRGATGAVPAADLSPAQNRIEYRRGALHERYENRPEGLEQSFVLPSPPGPKQSGKDLVHVELVLWGDLSPRVLQDRKAIDFVTPTGAHALHYAHLEAKDARGEILPASMEGFSRQDARGIRIVVDAGGATYPITIESLTTSAVWTAEGNQLSASFGWSVATAGDVNGDGFSDVIVGAKLYDNGSTDEGRAYVYLGSASGLASTAAWTAESNLSNAYFGASAATAGDVNADGYDDVIVGAYNYAAGQGRAYVYLGSASGLATIAAWVVPGTQAGSQFGWSVGTAGDIDGDGYADVIVGADLFDNGQTDEGRAYVYLGSASGLATSPAWTVEPNQAGARFGAAVATAGDVDADGFADVIVGAPGNGPGAGAVTVYLGSASGLATSPVWTEVAEPLGAAFGASVATAGDTNGDGYADVLVADADYSDDFNSNVAKFYAYTGSDSGPSSSPAWTVGDLSPSLVLGASVSTAGDVNGDGYADVIIGFRTDGSITPGRALVYLGSTAGLETVSAWDTYGEDSYGASVATAGDINGDGFSDIIVGEPHGFIGQSFEGLAYAYLGSPSAPVKTLSWSVMGSQPGEELGYSTASAGDVNGDGFSDVIVGASDCEDGVFGPGRALLYPGSASGLATSPAWTFVGGPLDKCLGVSVASAGDVNGDGYSDVVVGASGFGPYGSGIVGKGRAHVFLGSASGLAPTPAWTVEGDQDLAAFGGSVASAGDVNGDGYADVLVGAHRYDVAGLVDAGRAFLYLGSPLGPAVTPAWTAQSDRANAAFGFAVASAGDVNGDGYSDALVGAYSYNDTMMIRGGRVDLYLGSASGLSALPAWTDGLGYTDAWFGYAVGTAGDVNGDGYSDIVVGAALFNGRADLYLGAASGLPVLAWTKHGGGGSNLGTAVGTAGDANNDGYADVLVSAVNAGAGGEVLSLYYGSSAGLPTNPGWTITTYFPNGCLLGDSLATAGDVNGDGFSDIVAGDSCANPGGRAVAFYGSEGGGVLRLPRQLRTDGTTPIAYLGKSDSPNSFVLKERGITPAGRGKVRLQFEVEPLGTLFDGTGLSTPVTDTGTPGASGSDVDFSEMVTLDPPNYYHWRTRIVSADPFFPRSPWMTLEGKSMTESKLANGSCIDNDGDGYGVLGDPSCLNPAPDCSDADPTIWATPGEARNLRFPSPTVLTWDPPEFPGASAIVYDLLRSISKSTFLSPFTVCVESDDGADTTAAITEVPSVGQGFFYLTRAQNACPSGAGSLGNDSAGIPRQGRLCP